MAVKKSKATDPKEWVEIARTGLDGIATPEEVGEFLGTVDADGVILFRFASNLSGYPGWEWTVAVYAVVGQAPTVLEAELLAGDDSLLAPAWVPWSERLEIWKASQEAENESEDSADDDDSDEDFDEAEDDDDPDLDSDEDDFDGDDDENIVEDLDEEELLNPGTDHQLDEVVDDLLDDDSEDSEDEADSEDQVNSDQDEDSEK